MSIQIPAPVRAVTSVPLSSTSAKAGPIGPGAGVLMTEYGLSHVLGNNIQDRIARYLKMGNEVDWVRAAERIIGGRIAGCEWHLEDPDGETIDDDYKGSPLAVELYNVLQNPQADLPLRGVGGVGKRQSRRQQLSITSRHMGTAGTGVWFLDQLDGNGAPHAILYIRPDRLFPQYNSKNGVLIGYQLDVRPGDPGIPLPLEQVLLFQLQAPDVGVFGPGLLESSIAKATNSGLVDRHYTALLTSGGRLSGILAPKEGAITDDNVYNQMVRDWRNVTEQPESARRLQIVRAPVEFTPTVQSIGEMAITDLVLTNRDALLALWGVPLNMLGGASSGGGLNSGDSRQYDEAALWQGPVSDRLDEIAEGYQMICDLWESSVGHPIKFCFDKPSFDDDLPNYEKLKNSDGLAMRNKERRALVGLDPFGDPLLDNAVWMPTTVVAMVMAPDEETGKVPPGELPGLRAVAPPTRVPVEPGDTAVNTPAVKEKEKTDPAASTSAPKLRAIKGSLSDIREEWGARVTPLLTSATAAFLQEQRAAVAAAVEKNWEAIKRHGGKDESMWMPDPKTWDGRLLETLRPALQGMAAAVEADIDSRMGAKKADAQAMALSLGNADTGAVMQVLTRGSGRVTGINETTRKGINKLVAESIEKGLSPREAGDVVESWTGFDEYRAERIARTEMMFAYNEASLTTYGGYGVTQVEAIDGDQDAECLDRNGRIFSILEAHGIADHPNGTLDWAPL